MKKFGLWLKLYHKKVGKPKPTIKGTSKDQNERPEPERKYLDTCSKDKPNGEVLP